MSPAAASPAASSPSVALMEAASAYAEEMAPAPCAPRVPPPGFAPRGLRRAPSLVPAPRAPSVPPPAPTASHRATARPAAAMMRGGKRSSPPRHRPSFSQSTARERLQQRVVAEENVLAMLQQQLIDRISLTDDEVELLVEKEIARMGVSWKQRSAPANILQVSPC